MDQNSSEPGDFIVHERGKPPRRMPPLPVRSYTDMDDRLKAQSTPPSEPKSVKMTGYLEKRTKMLGWKKYWFVLDGRLLTYYKSKVDYGDLGACSGSINCGLASTVRPIQLRGYKGFALQIVTRTQTYFLRSLEKKNLEKWLIAIQELVAVPAPRDRWGDASLDYKLGGGVDGTGYGGSLTNSKRNSSSSSQWTLNYYCVSTEDLSGGSLSRNGALGDSNNNGTSSSSLKKYHSIASLGPSSNTGSMTTPTRSKKSSHGQEDRIMEEFKRELTRKVSLRGERLSNEEVQINNPPDLIKGTLSNSKEAEEVSRKPPFRPSQFDEFIDFEKDVYEPCGGGSETPSNRSSGSEVKQVQENIYEPVETPPQLNLPQEEPPKEFENTSDGNSGQFLPPIYNQRALSPGLVIKKPYDPEELEEAPPNDSKWEEGSNWRSRGGHRRLSPGLYTINKSYSPPEDEPPTKPQKIDYTIIRPLVPERKESLEEPELEVSKAESSIDSISLGSESSMDSLNRRRDRSNTLPSKSPTPSREASKKGKFGGFFQKIFRKDKEKRKIGISNISGPVNLRSDDLRKFRESPSKKDPLMDELKQRVDRLNRMNSEERTMNSSTTPRSLKFSRSKTLPDSETLDPIEPLFPPAEEPTPSRNGGSEEIHESSVIFETPPPEVPEKAQEDVDEKDEEFKEKLDRFKQMSTKLNPTLLDKAPISANKSILRRSLSDRNNHNQFRRLPEIPPALPPKQKNSSQVVPLSIYDFPQNNSPINPSSGGTPPPRPPSNDPPSSSAEDSEPEEPIIKKVPPPRPAPPVFSRAKKKYSAPSMSYDRMESKSIEFQETLTQIQRRMSLERSKLRLSDFEVEDPNEDNVYSEIEERKPIKVVQVLVPSPTPEDLESELRENIYANFDKIYCNCIELMEEEDRVKLQNDERPSEEVVPQKNPTEQVEELQKLARREKSPEKYINQMQEDVYNSPEVQAALDILEEAIESLGCDSDDLDPELQNLPLPPPPPPEEFLQFNFSGAETPSTPPDSPLIGNLQINLRSGQAMAFASKVTPPPPPPPPPPRKEKSPEQDPPKPDIKFATVNTIIQELETVEESSDQEELDELYDDFNYEFLPVPSPLPTEVVKDEFEFVSGGSPKKGRESLRHSGIDQLQAYLSTADELSTSPSPPPPPSSRAPCINRLGHSAAINQLQKIVGSQSQPISDI